MKPKDLILGKRSTMKTGTYPRGYCRKCNNLVILMKPEDDDTEWYRCVRCKQSIKPINLSTGDDG